MEWLALLSRLENHDPERFPLAEPLSHLPDETLANPDMYAAKPADRDESRDFIVLAVGRWCIEHGQVERGRKLLSVVGPKSPVRKKVDLLLQP